MSASTDHDKRLEIEALTLVEDVSHESDLGHCPNYMVPPRIPSQRLQGLARRGYLHYVGGSWRLTQRGREHLAELRATMDDQDVVEVLMDCGACGGDGKDHGLQEPERSMNPCPVCSQPPNALERLNTPDVREVLDGEGPAARCEFCGRFARPDGEGHGDCIREYDRRTVGL